MKKTHKESPRGNPTATPLEVRRFRRHLHLLIPALLRGLNLFPARKFPALIRLFPPGLRGLLLLAALRVLILFPPLFRILDPMEMSPL